MLLSIVYILKIYRNSVYSYSDINTFFVNQNRNLATSDEQTRTIRVLVVYKLFKTWDFFGILPNQTYIHTVYTMYLQGIGNRHVSV